MGWALDFIVIFIFFIRNLFFINKIYLKYNFKKKVKMNTDYRNPSLEILNRYFDEQVSKNNPELDAIPVALNVESNYPDFVYIFDSNVNQLVSQTDASTLQIIQAVNSSNNITSKNSSASTSTQIVKAEIPPQKTIEKSDKRLKEKRAYTQKFRDNQKAKIEDCKEKLHSYEKCFGNIFKLINLEDCQSKVLEIFKEYKNNITSEPVKKKRKSEYANDEERKTARQMINQVSAQRTRDKKKNLIEQGELAISRLNEVATKILTRLNGQQPNLDKVEDVITAIEKIVNNTFLNQKS